MRSNSRCRRRRRTSPKLRLRKDGDFMIKYSRMALTILYIFAFCTSISSASFTAASDERSYGNESSYADNFSNYLMLLDEYYNLLNEYSQVDKALYYKLDYSATALFYSMLLQRDSVFEKYAYSYTQYYEIPQTMIYYSMIYRIDNGRYRFIQYSPSYNNSTVFIQNWNEDYYDCSKLITFPSSPVYSFEVMNYAIYEDTYTNYAIIIVKMQNWERYKESCVIFTYDLNNGVFLDYFNISLKNSIGNWYIQEYESMLDNSKGIEIMIISEINRSSIENLRYSIFDSTLVLYDDSNIEGAIELVFEEGMWNAAPY